MRPQPNNIRRTANIVLAALFFAAIAFPGISSLIGLVPAPVLNENRNLAPPPALAWKRAALRAFPTTFDAYFNDHFAFRDQLVWWHNYAETRWLGVSPRADVLIGKGGWLYLKQGLLDQDRAVAPFTDEQLAQRVQSLKEKQAWLAARGCRYLVVIPPDKHTIYPENLPGWVKRVPRSNHLDQFLTYAQAHSNLDLLDLRPALRQAKQEEQVFLQTDTHWTATGAYAGYRGITDALGRWFPEVRAVPRSAFSSQSGQWPGDLAIMLGLPEVFHEQRICLAPRTPPRAHSAACPEPRLDLPEPMRPIAVECDDQRLPRAVMFHDSFGLGLQPFLSEHFRRMVYVRGGPFDPGLVESENPEVVIEEFVERRLTEEPPANPTWVAAASPDRGADE